MLCLSFQSPSQAWAQQAFTEASSGNMVGLLWFLLIPNLDWVSLSAGCLFMFVLIWYIRSQGYIWFQWIIVGFFCTKCGLLDVQCFLNTLPITYIWLQFLLDIWVSYVCCGVVFCVFYTVWLSQSDKWIIRVYVIIWFTLRVLIWNGHSNSGEKQESFKKHYWQPTWKLIITLFEGP